MSAAEWDGCPVRLLDGRFGVVIRTPTTRDPRVGVQVDNDPILWIAVGELVDFGGGALMQIAAPGRMGS